MVGKSVGGRVNVPFSWKYQNIWTQVFDKYWKPFEPFEPKYLKNIEINGLNIYDYIENIAIFYA